MSPIERLTKLGLLKADRAKQHWIKHNASDQCKPGCSGCCYQPVGVALIEALHICMDTLFNTSVIDNLHRNSIGEPCPFLVDNECKIYPIRPIACSTLYPKSICTATPEMTYTEKIRNSCKPKNNTSPVMAVLKADRALQHKLILDYPIMHLVDALHVAQELLYEFRTK